MTDWVEITGPVGIKNTTCVYCGRRRSADYQFTREHIVGRRFVPSETIALGPSLILNACRECNQEKADLEDDISAITLLPNLETRDSEFPHADTIRRKLAGSISRATRKPVSQSFVKNSIKGSLMPGVEVSFGFIAPPVIDAERIQKLAALQLQAFCYWQTYDHETRTGRFLDSPVTFLPAATRRDWGNVELRHFAELTHIWPKTFLGCFADGYFQVILRKAPTDASVHAFALEWNKNLRVTGFIGDRQDTKIYEASFPLHAWKYRGPNERYRLEIPMSEEEDVLFA